MNMWSLHSASNSCSTIVLGRARPEALFRFRAPSPPAEGTNLLTALTRASVPKRHLIWLSKNLQGYCRWRADPGALKVRVHHRVTGVVYLGYRPESLRSVMWTPPDGCGKAAIHYVRVAMGREWLLLTYDPQDPCLGYGTTFFSMLRMSGSAESDAFRACAEEARRTGRASPHQVVADAP
ncbi:hypothetical protein JNJ66_05090 [Candidatus Saccharibacteria bacterium]|nr:hypothetical protein [Candidatus Saccharibacteria bacterium]